jgi:hypothetical protein
MHRGDCYGFFVHAGSKFASLNIGPLYGIAAGVSPIGQHRRQCRINILCGSAAQW